MREPLAALILAAGHSSRMGTLKPLLRFGALTALEQVVRRIQEGGVSDIRVVIGHGGATLRAALPDLPVRWITNPDPDRGMLSSVVAGVATLRAERDAFLLLPADIPLVRPETIAALLAEWRRHQPPPPVLYPLYRGKRGHPPLIATYCVTVQTPSPQPSPARGEGEREIAACATEALSARQGSERKPQCVTVTVPTDTAVVTLLADTPAITLPVNTPKVRVPLAPNAVMMPAGTPAVRMPADTPGGLRTILRAWDSQARELAVDDPAILLDCDTPADYARLLQQGGFGLA